MVLRVGRNLAGGGDRAAGKLTIDQLKLRRAEVIIQIRQSLITSVLNYEAAARARELASSRLTAYTTNLPIIELAYRLGDGETSAMLSLWEHGEELRAALAKAEADLARERSTITLLVFPQTASRSAISPLTSR
jgi:outer membrane protein TolC